MKIMRNVLVMLLMFTVLSVFAQKKTLDLLDQWKDESIVGSEAYNNAYNEVWGYVKDGVEYAMIGSTYGTHVFIVESTGKLKHLFDIEGESSGPHIIHRDYHDYKGYLYEVADEDKALDPTSLRIYDLSALPDSLPIVYNSSNLMNKVHNIFIDESAGKLYTLASKGGKTGYHAMKVFSLEDPVNPVELGQYSSIGDIKIGHVHDAYVKNDTAILNCGFDGLVIAEFSQPEPNLIAYFSIDDYPESGYNHSGYATEDMAYYYFADETHGSSMKIVDLNGFQEIEIKGVFDAGEQGFSIAHNQLVHGDYLYVSYYYEGMQVFDISDRENPVNVAYYPTSTYPISNSYEGNWGVYPYLPSGKILASDMQEGLFVINCVQVDCSNVILTQSEAEYTDIAIYPNPAHGTFVLISNGRNVQRITLKNQAGQPVAFNQERTDNQEIMVDVSTPGVYFLEILLENGVIQTNKVVVID